MKKQTKRGGYTYSRRSTKKSRKSNNVEKPYSNSPYKPKPLPVIKK